MILLVLLFAGLSFGLSIEEAIKTALERNPHLKALEERLGVYRGMERSALAFPNPEVSLETGFITRDKDGKPSGRAVYLLEYSQPFPLWGVREKGRRVVAAEQEAFISTVEARRREILAEVYRRFYSALVRKEIVDIWSDSVKTAREVERFVQKAYELGEVTELELLRARRERSMAEVRLRISESRFRAGLKERAGWRTSPRLRR